MIPFMEDALSMPQELSGSDYDKIEETARGIIKVAPSVAIRMEAPDDSLPQQARGITLTLTPSETRDAVESCKAGKVSVTAAVHAALAVTNMRNSDGVSGILPY